MLLATSTCTRIPSHHNPLPHTCRTPERADPTRPTDPTRLNHVDGPAGAAVRTMPSRRRDAGSCSPAPSNLASPCRRGASSSTLRAPVGTQVAGARRRCHSPCHTIRGVCLKARWRRPLRCALQRCDATRPRQAEAEAGARLGSRVGGEAGLDGLSGRNVEGDIRSGVVSPHHTVHWLRHVEHTRCSGPGSALTDLQGRSSRAPSLGPPRCRTDAPRYCDRSATLTTAAGTGPNSFMRPSQGPEPA